MSTTVQAPTDTEKTPEEDTRRQDRQTRPSVNHILRKSDILRSMVEGVPVPGLCGQTIRVGSHGDGRVNTLGRPGAVKCPRCYYAYETMAD